MLDEDLAQLYGVQTKRLNEQVKRNTGRFPADFMFRLTEPEWQNLKSQFATANPGGRRTLPYAFTGHGVLMLSGVLTSATAIEVNIQIMRVYTRIRDALASHQDILLKLETLEKTMLRAEEKSNRHDNEIQAIFQVLRELVQAPATPRRRIGFKQDV